MVAKDTYIFKILENISHAYFLIRYFDLSAWGLLCHSMERVGGRRRPVRRGDLPWSSQSCLWLSRRAAATRVHKKPAEAGKTGTWFIHQEVLVGSLGAQTLVFMLKNSPE